MSIHYFCSRWHGLVLLSAALMAVQLVAQEHPSEPAKMIDFARDIRPILSATCFGCHGPDEATREADLRLDDRESVFDESGVVVPGDIDASELYQRLITNDEYSKMPPPDEGEPLTVQQIESLRLWIEQGAEWSEHWSFKAPAKSALPQVQHAVWPENEIDTFILANNELMGLSQNPPADRATLIRRLTLDLTGLPPTPEEVQAFTDDPSADAFERVVDRLLNSPRYGEHQARFWLDAARYGDTHGLHLDNYREMWLYRDWVIDAFNRNLPYDQFVIEQLAGDLLTNPTEAQRIATGFNRAHVTTNEGGSIEEEVFVRNVTDRVATTGTVFMGLTVACAACHDHKYDPISMREFYQLFAYFNSLDGPPMDGNAKVHEPSLAKPTEDQRVALQRLDEELATTRQQIDVELAKIEYVEPEQTVEAEFAGPVEFVWVDDDLPDGAKPHERWEFVSVGDGPVLSGKKSHKGSANGFHQHFFVDATKPLRIAKGDLLFCYAYLDPENLPQQIMLQWNDGSWDHRVYWGENIINFGTDGSAARLRLGDLPAAGEWVRLEVPAEKVNLQPGALVHGWAFSQSGGTVYWDKAGIVSDHPQNIEYHSFTTWIDDQRKTQGAGLPEKFKKGLSNDQAELDEQELAELQRYFLQNVYHDTREVFAPLQQRIEQLEKQRSEVQAMVPTTLVYREKPEPRPAFMLDRGQYDAPGEPVERDVPKFLPRLPVGVSNDRLGLAKWLVDPHHPLTARVQVNRIWQQFFGTGIVQTTEDFGAQGTWPSHPQLLDWLAVEFVDSGWDIKHIIKLIVMSATYQQASRITAEGLVKDPQNRWLSRGPRYRLDAETLRDQALAVSGLLVDRIGGPSVKPPQPDGLWFAVGYSGSNTVRFKKDDGPEKVHRRSLYTFWKRTAPPPQMSIMDAPSREECSVRRERTNTPLQALMLMNDPQYVEAARYFAQLILGHPGDTHARIEWMFKRALGRKPSTLETNIFEAHYQAAFDAFKSDEDGARRLVSIGEEPARLDGLAAVELAAWTMTANLIMNLDEFVSKP